MSYFEYPILSTLKVLERSYFEFREKNSPYELWQVIKFV